jgi:hypothetical protein
VVRAVSILALLLGGIATSSAAAATLTSPAPVSALAADRGRVAFAVGRSSSDRDRVRIWTPATGGVVRLGRTTPCVTTSTGTGIASVAIAGMRVLWLQYTGGNIREWRLFTATPMRPVPRRLAFVTADVDPPAPIVVGDGDASRLGDILPYAVGRTVIALRANGARRFSWTAPTRVVALSTLSGNGVLVQRGRTLELRGGRAARTWTLAAGARLEDTAGGDRALYVVGNQARMLVLSLSRDVRLAAATHVQGELATIVVSSGRTVRTLRAG